MKTKQEKLFEKWDKNTTKEEKEKLFNQIEKITGFKKSEKIIKKSKNKKNETI